MGYEIYKNILDKESYFKQWKNQSDVFTFTDDLKDYIYNKYLVKCAVFQRDGFKCQNINCKSKPDTKNSTLTLHHVKFQKNGGENKEKNGITLCRGCHQGFHGGIPITFADIESLPTKLRGMTYKIDIKHEIDWKRIKFEMKQLRKNLREYKGYRIPVDQLIQLLKFFEYDFDSEDD